MELKPIGYVSNRVGRRRYNGWRGVVSEIIIDTEYAEALEGLEGFSHIYVLFYLHEIEGPFKMKIHPTGNPEYPLVGAFSTRTPNRPNPLGLTLCKLLSRKGNVLRVKGLDAYDGSPIIDVKPYSHPGVDDVRVPDWVLRLRREMSNVRSVAEE